MNFGELERVFHTQLPAALRAAWGTQQDIEWITVDIPRLIQLSNTLSRQYELDLALPPTKTLRLLPFAHGPNDTYLALVLDRDQVVSMWVGDVDTTVELGPLGDWLADPRTPDD